MLSRKTATPSQVSTRQRLVYAIASEFQSAVLKFKAAGVDHVMVTPDNGDAAIFFTQVAESQGYRPRYAMTTAIICRRDSVGAVADTTFILTERTEILHSIDELPL